ncbi:MAG: sugar transferase [Anaerolineae bacterium]|jgi:lipopolysaccharide/colanic/teichoic acid biosynthesis glycosyltransferase|nr:sugar transferase [Anaerolineae bacterium]
MEQIAISRTINLNKPVYFRCKRGIDIIASVLLLLFLAPLLSVIALLIKLDSPGPVIFAQDRVGLKRTNGRRGKWELCTFTCYKFRTMQHNADSSLHRAFIQAFINDDDEGMAALNGEDTQTRKLVRDPRVTRVGRLLRNSSLDELPQLLNVLRGDMSLVGPRPPIPYEVDMYRNWHLRRLETIPGLTGVWQISARSEADFDQMVNLDIWYIEHQSLWLDLKILFKTPIVVLRGKGAV